MEPINEKFSPRNQLAQQYTGFLAALIVGLGVSVATVLLLSWGWSLVKRVVAVDAEVTRMVAGK